MNKKSIILIVVLLVVAFALFYFKNMDKKEAMTPTVEYTADSINQNLSADTTSDIDTSLNEVNLDLGIDSEMQSLDAEINNL